MIDREGARWRKSSRSGGASGSCVEVAWNGQGRAFRDSKNPASGELTFDDDTARRFLAAVKAGQLNG
ncbi:DUF397 domain-containing protein [Umezawaea tangerina]|uniref:Uncharacterized protein DUF397 n=1 Tax=Umezawaea tangerina TaxID=84725 RepID=A0A2T0TCD0_9PSEU|nr:DUF397 domain-containing protein [Umezawaea tangerina]PRY43311.1 uncharacterized protein DUF397 [Umezawaea tangerina]